MPTVCCTSTLLSFICLPTKTCLHRFTLQVLLELQAARMSVTVQAEATAVVRCMQACVLHASCFRTLTCLWHCWMLSSHVLELPVQVRFQTAGNS